MAESIKLPSQLSGTPENQLQQLYSYLYQTAQALNVNLKEIGNGALTDDEMELMNRITASLEVESGQPATGYNYAEAETLKSLIIKTAQFVKNEVDNYRIILFGEESAEGSQGKWKRKKGLRVDVTPDGTQQTYSYAEIIQGLKTYEINAKNYIKTGFLRTENALPVYGVAIGKDVVTFAEDGTETYNDGNKVAELTADALSFYQGGNLCAKYTGSKLSFYIGGSEVFYIQSGKIYCVQDLELATGKKLIINTTNFKVDSSGNVTISGKIAAGSGSTFAGTMSADCITSGSIDASVIDVKNINASKITSGAIDASVIEVKNINASKITSGTMSANKISGGSIDASNVTITNLNASNITSGTMSANKISGGTIDATNVTINNLNASKITSGTIDASVIEVKNINASKITSGTMSANKISGGSIDASNVTITNLNASNISSGTMSASKISGGTLTLGGNNNANGTLIIKNANGTQIGKWDKDGIEASTGTFTGTITAGSGSTFAGTMSAGCITSGTMSANRISGGSIDATNVTITNLNASNITSGTMSASKISGGTIDATNVTINNLNASKITSGVIDASVIEVKNINASKISSGTMSANKISGGSIDASNVTITNLNASNISSGTMSASKISGGTLTLGGNNNTNGKLIINNGSGTQIGKWDKDGIEATSGTFRGKLAAADGTFEVDAGTKKIKAGNWTFDDAGLSSDKGTGNNRIIHSIFTYDNELVFYFSKPNMGDTNQYDFTQSSFYGSINTTPRQHPNLGTSTYPWGTVYYDNLSQVSSRERKHNIQPLLDRGAEIDALQPVTFVYNDDAKKRTRAGLIYEDTISVMPEICSGDEENKAINYVELIPYLLKEIQDLRKRVKALENKEDR